MAWLSSTYVAAVAGLNILFHFSIGRAIFLYVSPFPSNRHSSRAFGYVWCVSLRQLLILFLCILGDVVWCVVVSATYNVLVFLWATFLVCGCVCNLQRSCVSLGDVWCVVVSVV